ncbi:hypothetical protein B5M09_001921 [Aphanomyces astaci]|uniref:Protein kinase domain-containing protein n=1 Tax=Aphanomyces astaci TaxID=112090 RepID=A0A425DLY2_APHAT|nr:hypothetical protein B5M09_001921 [Aphanomyces astaci]
MATPPSPSSWLESTDYVSRFRLLEAANLTSVPAVRSPAPASVVERLTALTLKWEDLSSLAQRALLWDMGFVRLNDGSTTLQQVYTRCSLGTSTPAGATMENLMVSKDAFLATDQSTTVIKCSSGSALYVRQNISNGVNLDVAANCAVAPTNPSKSSHSSMWAQDGLPPTDVPFPVIMRHQWNSTDGPPFLIFAVHTVPEKYDGEWPWGSLVLPCKVYEGAGSGMCLPSPSSRMNDWLEAIARSKMTLPPPIVTTTGPTPIPPPPPSLATGAIVGIVAGAIAFLACGLWCLLLLRRRRRATDGHATAAPYTSDVRHSSGQPRSSAAQHQPIQTNSSKLNNFQIDPYLCSRRLPYSSVVQTRMVSKGAFGEVWVGSLDGVTVAIKKVLDAKRNDVEELECFAEEIRLLASLSHPNIVTFIGFAWNTLQNLCCVVEYMQHGDLGSYLAAHQEAKWDDKLVLAVGIARALAYLHALTPNKIIHRDLKAKNVLVSDQLDAKLSDFGISKERTTDETMTAGVGTTYWTAPEVLSGHRYSELADVYSFGCVLNELDTHNIPYANMKGVPALTIVQRVTTMGLRPTFNDTCPKLIKDLAERCLATNPRDRPTAIEIVRLIELWKGW